MAAAFGCVSGEPDNAALRLSFDCRIRLHFHGAKLNSDGGLLLFRELDEVLGLTAMAAWELRDRRTGRNAQHSLLGRSRPSMPSFDPETAYSTPNGLPFRALATTIVVDERPSGGCR